MTPDQFDDQTDMNGADHAAAEGASAPDAQPTAQVLPEADAPPKPAAKKKAKRTRKTTKKVATPPSPEAETEPEGEPQAEAEAADAPAKPAAKKKAKRSRKKAPAKAAATAEVTEPAAELAAEPAAEPAAEAAADSADAQETQADAETSTDAETEDETDAKPKRSRGRRSRKKTDGDSDDEPRREREASTKGESKSESKGEEALPDADMVINYVPGEECRIAVVENKQLEEFYSEPTDRISRVGNIYVGKVTNVESSIQAAFVDFGVEDNGFLHVSDLHPIYFPGESGDITERVGKKIPRRDRPPIQDALKRGQEIIVQVLKEGVGTKGPTLTAYLSIPGRFLVMMPNMDKVGVSRKEEDDDRRKEARKILDQLDLPEGFGFILRTAGFGRTKTELKRDLAYLNRLWKDMEKRRKVGNRPRLLYSESDLLVRSLRDLLASNVKRVIVDDEAACARASRFMKIVAPRSQAELVRYTGNRPVFHAFGIEEQIRQIHSRDVPLPSGGRLVIDQTEALVAIDVNSGKSRRASDSETNAYQTNVEAVDVICRQLRLRDLGGLVISDLIDMRAARHRKDIENRFKDRLKRDRARSTILPISQFGILEMTRQRMRGSQESLHFAGCPTCTGRGIVQRPDSVASDALRELAFLLDSDRVTRAEVVVHPRVAGALLSTHRQGLMRVEIVSGKKIDVRVSDSIPLDRVTFYVYDAHGADLDVIKLARNQPKPKLVTVHHAAAAGDDPEAWAIDPRAEAEETTTAALAEHLAKADSNAQPEDQMLDIAEDAAANPGGNDTRADRDDDDDSEGGRKKRRRRRRGRRGRGGEGDPEGAESSAQAQDGPESDGEDDAPADRDRDDVRQESDDSERDEGEPGEGGRKKRRRRRRRGRGSEGEDAANNDDGGRRAEVESDADADEGAQDDRDDEPDRDEAEGERPKRKRRRSRRGRGGSKGETAGNDGDTTPADSSATRSGGGNASAASESEAKPAKPRRRGLYASSRRKLGASEISRIGED
ncbi:MAG: Rne/Rng family ribonuclease [Planctomycetota bacterium]